MLVEYYYHCFPSGASATLSVKKRKHMMELGITNYGTDVVKHRQLMLTETSSSTGVFPHKSFLMALFQGLVYSTLSSELDTTL